MNKKHAFVSASLVLLAGLYLGGETPCWGQSVGKQPSDKKTGAPVNITVFGNKLIVTSEDPQALALVSELVRLLTQPQSGLGDFQVIRLKNANAVDASKILDELFNGPKPTAPQGGAGGKGGGPGRGGFPFGPGNNLGAAMAATQRVERIRIVPDSATNALLVQANPLDMMALRKIVTEQLDAGVNDADAVIKTFVIGPLKFAHATDVQSVLRDIYRESMDNNRRGLGQIQSPFGATRAPTTNIDANGNPKGVTLSMGVDDKTNSLIVACPTPMYKDIKSLVEQMETAAKDTKQTVKIVPVKGIDPALIQEALDAIQGRTTATRTNTNNSSIFSGGTGRGVGLGGRLGR